MEMVSREMKTIGEICNFAANQVADGWEIEISIIGGVVAVKLYDELGERMDFDLDQDDLEKAVKEAVSYSREHAS